MACGWWLEADALKERGLSYDAIGRRLGHSGKTVSKALSKLRQARRSGEPLVFRKPAPKSHRGMTRRAPTFQPAVNIDAAEILRLHSRRVPLTQIAAVTGCRYRDIIAILDGKAA